MPKKPQLSDEDEALRREFGRRVTAVREQLGMRPAEFAAVGGISMAHQYRIEAGERTAEVLYVQRLAARFGGMVVTMLLGGVTQAGPPASGGLIMNNSGAGAVQVGSGTSVIVNAPVYGGVAGRDNNFNTETPGRRKK